MQLIKGFLRRCRSMLRKYYNKILTILKLSTWSLFSKIILKKHPKIYRGSNRSYRKFIIFTHPRSGSSMTIHTLRSHPQIMGFGELFNDKRIGYNIKGYNNHLKKLDFLRRKDPIDFLERHIFTSYRNDIKAVGFKLFSQQLDNEHFKDVWAWLVKNKDIKIVFLSRNNYLASLVSLLIASKTGKFGIKDESERTNSRIMIDHQKCVEEFQKMEIYQKDALKHFNNHEVLKVSYEEIVSDLDHIFYKFQRFLEVDPYEIRVNTIRQETRPLSEVIVNYNQLCEYFKDTKWEYLFND